MAPAAGQLRGSEAPEAPRPWLRASHSPRRLLGTAHHVGPLIVSVSQMRQLPTVSHTRVCKWPGHDSYPTLDTVVWMHKTRPREGMLEPSLQAGSSARPCYDPIESVAVSHTAALASAPRLWPLWLLAPLGEGTQTSQQINTTHRFPNIQR